MRTLRIDIETYSSVDLAKSGVFRYCQSPDFEILLFGYSVDGGEARVVDVAYGEALPADILEALTDDTVQKWAFNAQFERICLSKWLKMPAGQYLDPQSWRCTMVWSAYMGLPLSLEGVGAVLGLEKQKLTEGKDLIRYFCKPCSPTAANGGRTRNLPSHAPDKWAAFKSYNRRDVETEMAIQQKLARFPVPEDIWDEYHLDQEINDRGVALDMTLVRNAIIADERSRTELTGLIQELTELENPNSVAQIKQWLADNGMETDTLGKKVVTELLKEAPEPLGRVLSLRQSLAKSSVKKYTAMEQCACADNRVRGLFQFYGANRTGRFSGRLLQPQNLPQNHMPDLEQARGLVCSGNFKALEMLYDSVPEVLSELIRTAFVPKDGRKLIIADFSSIERVVLAWIAGESWVLDAYREKKDLYIATASQMFRVPAEQIGKKSVLRQKGKVADLACIAEGQFVLTDKGLTPIEKITKAHRLWDGEDWVTHEGLIDKGFSEVIYYDGLTATPDHLVWVEGQSQPIQFGVAASSGAHLVQTGNGRKPIRLGENNQPGKALEPEVESLLRTHQVYRLWKHPVAAIKQLATRHIKRLPAMFTTKEDSQMARQTFNSSEATLRKSKRFRLLQLWRERHTFRFPKCHGSWPLLDIEAWLADTGDGDRPNRQRKKLHIWKYSFCDSCRKQFKQALYSTNTFCSGILAIFAKCGDTKTFSGFDAESDYCGCRKSCIRKAEKLENYRRKARLYDIRNAGRNHRFTVSGKLVHNCGYGGSVGALKAMGALEMGLAEDELRPLVTAWRAANPNIVKFWWAVDRAAMTAVRDRTSTETHGIRFTCQSGMLFITLPSGRRLCYVKPRIGTNQFGSDCVTYEGVGGTKKWERIESYGPKFVENIVQATSRDILCYAMQTLRHSSIVMHVHDEIVIEADLRMSAEAVCEQMSRMPPWAQGLLLRAEGYETGFYKKD